VTGAIALAQGLQQNNTLTVLNLDRCNIMSIGGSAFGAAVQHNTALKVLYLSGNNIGAEGATALASALNRNTTLQVLDLHDNGIFEVGVVIQSKIAHNNLLYENQFWRPALHADFPGGFESVLLTTLLCNNSMNEAKLPAHIWHQIFGFWPRNTNF